jgi:hypothetical protein
MDIDTLADLLANGQLQPDSPEFQLAEKRQQQFDLLAKVRNAKRALEEPTQDSRTPKRHKSEFKYTNIEKLTSRASLRQFADWKADMLQLFKCSPDKFATDSMRLIAAQQYMDDKAKTLWRAHLHAKPQDEAWPTFLQWAESMVARGANSKIRIYQDYCNARQADKQTPAAFDAYLSSLESVMEERSTSISAMEFFTRLTEPLQTRMELSGRESFPNTREEMVAFAQRIWHGMTKVGKIKSPSYDRPSHDRPGHNKPKDQRQFPNSQNDHYRDRRRTGLHQQPKLRPGETQPQPRKGKETLYPTGKNEKGEACCYKCGSTTHFAKQCSHGNPQQSESKPYHQDSRPKVAPIRIEEVDSPTDSSEN